MFHLAVYVPVEHAEKVKLALFAAGAGRIGNYAQCSFESEGLGQFMPLAGSQPFVGEQEKLEKVRELKVEMVCEETHLAAAIDALKAAHPYETPAYYVIKTLGIQGDEFNPHNLISLYRYVLRTKRFK
jgi:structural toxin protein (hemagglutinin/hemolysin) RtxA